jgi:phosphatidylglycerol:prolipoprotein diacylglycerol transferase
MQGQTRSTVFYRSGFVPLPVFSAFKLRAMPSDAKGRLMIPYLEVPPLHIGVVLSLQPFGLLVVSGCLVGYAVSRAHAKRVGLDPSAFRRLVLWVLLPAFIVAHWVSMLFYFPSAVWQHPASLLTINTSLSSYGGFMGAALGAWLYWRRHGQRDQLACWPAADAIAVGWLAGWIFGRLGCTVAHDHPGLASTFFLAVNYPQGPRHDLGFYEWLFTLGLNLAIFTLRRQSLAPGALLGIISVCYAPVRFAFDFLRAVDKRYLGLTPGQYFSVALFLVGVWILTTIRRSQSHTCSHSVAIQEECYAQ